MAVKKFREGLGLDPQSSDPISPFTGQVQYADGVTRAQGLWSYDGADWVRIASAGVSSLTYRDVVENGVTISVSDGVLGISGIAEYNTNMFSTLPTATSAEGLTISAIRLDNNTSDYFNTFDSASDVDTTADTFDLSGTDSGLTTGMAVQVTTTGTLPSPLVVSTTYYVYVDPGDPDLISLATTYSNAIAGTIIDLTTTGSDFTTISNSPGFVRILPNGSDTINGEANFALNTQYSQVSLYSDGDNWLILSDKDRTTGDIYLHSGNGHGSSSNKVRRYSTVAKNEGSALTLSQNATFGDTITINENGVYAVSWGDSKSSSTIFTAVTVSTVSGTTSASSLTYADGRRAGGRTPGTALTGAFSWTGRLSSGDYIRIYDDGTADDTSDFSYLNVVKVGE